ncbi:GNAT family N-acetyltransferase [Streptomyces sp. HNM0663]|uniref:GNAT family N-acetyltransferase n=1 Tax=Streptomyces chengmaiensis TaxID=3040919 RepID=A0ABT6HFL9_9ACTN|nr:GNAT family N-acetyltransferase [Streptomyces chengmaiensis]MDH2387473.1 GNAT family N-acetyltransferase [Streptomyces chengmaiensis]
MSFPSVADAVTAWVDGWVVSRGAADPIAEPWGFTVHVGQVTHATRHVLTARDEAAVRKVAEAVAAPSVWLKVFADPARVRAWAGPVWREDEPGFLMAAELCGGSVAAPDGYTLTTWTRGGVVRALVTAADGSFAARGQIAPTGRTAVVDQVETSAAHRRRGLGSLVMRTLQNAALDRGATVGVLGATSQGRALYECLGWRVQAPLVSLFFDTSAGPAA